MLTLVKLNWYTIRDAICGRFRRGIGLNENGIAYWAVEGSESFIPVSRRC